MGEADPIAERAPLRRFRRPFACQVDGKFSYKELADRNIGLSELDPRTER